MARRAMPLSPAEHFKTQLHRNHLLVRRLDEPEFPTSAFTQIQNLQRDRLQRSYADLRAEPRYEAAIDFFLAELYGGKDISRRDHDVGRVYPVMVRMLPGATLTAIGDAFSLQAVSLELDITMSLALHDLAVSQPLDLDLYGMLYRQTLDTPLRERQIELIGTLGRDLATAVRSASLNRLIRVLRQPARLAGFSALQRFLEDGLTSFRIMGEPGYFLDTICGRERQFMQAIINKDPDPFRLLA
nr:hypothetical protein [uncultured bacterium]